MELPLGNKPNIDPVLAVRDWTHMLNLDVVELHLRMVLHELDVLHLHCADGIHIRQRQVYLQHFRHHSIAVLHATWIHYHLLLARLELFGFVLSEVHFKHTAWFRLLGYLYALGLFHHVELCTQSTVLPNQHFTEQVGLLRRKILYLLALDNLVVVLLQVGLDLDHRPDDVVLGQHTHLLFNWFLHHIQTPLSFCGLVAHQMLGRLVLLDCPIVELFRLAPVLQLLHFIEPLANKFWREMLHKTFQ